MARKHALLSASGAERWLNCTPSARLEEKIKDTDSPYAAEGTLAHDIAELLLRKELGEITERKYKASLEFMSRSEHFYPGMVDEVEAYTTYCLEQYNEACSLDPISQISIEERVDFSKFVPEGFGTADCIIAGGNTLEVIDLKFGKGVEVSPVENSQLMLYALGAYTSYGFIYPVEYVKMTVAQVRLDNISSYLIPISQLLEWANNEVKPRANLAFKGGGEIKPGTWCRWCKVRATCKVRAEGYMEFLDKYDYENPALLSVREVAKILEVTGEISSWIKDLEEYALTEALKGTKFKGWKVVEGRSNRIIEDTETLADRLLEGGFKEDQIYKPKTLEGITNLEKIVGKKKFMLLAGDLITKPAGKPVLVVESDKRPELNSAEEDFFN